MKLLSTAFRMICSVPDETDYIDVDNVAAEAENNETEIAEHLPFDSETGEVLADGN